MTGMATGAFVCSVIKKDFKDELRLFSGLELIIGCSGFLSIFLYSNQSVQFLISLSNQLAYNPNYNSLFLYSFVFITLLIPTMCMGATLPALAGYAENNFKSPSKFVSRLYGANTLGAFVGTIFCGIYLLPALGIKTTLVLVGCVNLVISVAAILIDKNKKASQIKKTLTDSNQSEQTEVSNHIFLPVVFISGLTFFTMEVIWTRYLVILFGSSSYALSLVLAICLLGLAVGAFLSEFISHKNPRKIVSLILLSSAIFLGICLFQFDKTPFLYLQLVSMFSDTSSTRILPMVVTSLSMVFIPATLLGSVFPYILSLSGKTTSTFSRSTARLLAVNITGTITGAVLGYLLFRFDFTHLYKSSIQTGTILAAIFLLLTGIAVISTGYLSNKSKGKLDTIALVFALLAVMIILVRPQWNEKLMTVGYFFISPTTLKGLGPEKTIQSYLSNNEFLYYREGSNSTIAVKRNKKNNISVLTANGKVEASIPIKRSIPSPFSDLTTHTLMGLSPSIFCPNDNQEALIIGYGSGTTCGTTTNFDWVKSAVVVDIDQSIFSIDQYFQPSNLVPLKFKNLHSKKTTPVVADARNYLNFSTGSWDVIVSQPSEPWISGSSNMYTKEFFSLVKSKLKEKGVFGQWIQLYSISENDLVVLINTFQRVFGKTFIIHPNNAGELILLGFKNNDQISYKLIDNRIKSTSAAYLLNQIGVTNTESYLSLITHLPEDLSSLKKSSSVSNTDDNLYSEFHMGKNITPSDKAIEKLNLWLCREVLPENTSSTLIDYLSKSEKETPGKLAIEIAKKNFLTTTPSSERDLYLNYSSNIHTTRKHFCPLQLTKIKRLLDALDSDSKRIIEARIHQMIKANPEASKYFYKSYSDLKRSDYTPQSDGFLEAVLARFWYEEKYSDKAVKHAKNVIPEKTNNPSAFLMAGKVLLYSNQYDEAIRKMSHSINLGNGSYESLSNLALALHFNGSNDDKVIPLLEESCKLNPNQYIARYLLGVLKLKNDKLYPGLTQMIYANKVSGNDSSTNVYVTAAFVKIHHWVNAKQNLANLEKKDPDSQYIPILKYQIAKGENNKTLADKLLGELKKKYNAKFTDTELQSLNKIILESPVPHLMSKSYMLKLNEMKRQNTD